MDYRKFINELVYNLSDGRGIRLCFVDGRKIKLKPKNRFTCGVKMLDDCATLDFHKGRPTLTDSAGPSGDVLSLIASGKSLMLFIRGETNFIDIPWDQLERA